MNAHLSPNRAAAQHFALRLLSAAVLGLAAVCAQASPLPSGSGVYLYTSSNQWDYVGDAAFSYASGPGVSAYNPGGFQIEGGSFDHNVVNPGPGGFPLGLTSASLEQISTSDKGTSNAKAAASLEEGVLRATANSNNGYVTTCGTPTCLWSTSNMQAITYFRDTVTFHVAGGGSTKVHVNAHVDGTVSAGVYTGATSQLFSIFNLGAASFSYLASGDHDGQKDALSEVIGGFMDGLFSADTYTGFDFGGDLMVADGATLPLFYFLQARGLGGIDADFGHTARFSFGLADGVSFTSGSGVLLTAISAAPGVPEPASLALMLAGLAGMALVRRAVTASPPRQP